jgi:hypothetical protein
LPFALALAILNLNKPLKLKNRTLYSKEKILQPMSNSLKLSSDVTSEQASKTFKSLLQFGLFISMPNSWTPVSLGGMTFIPIRDCYFEPVCCM